MIGPSFTANYQVLLAVGSRGGMIMAVSDAYFRLSDFQPTQGSISATITMLADGLDWTLSRVYGPQGEQEKLLFINELRGLKYVVKPRWLIHGDFNLITKAADGNNQNINNRLIGSLCSALNHLQLKEMRLSGRKFTWSNAQESPVLTKIDHFFHSDDWDGLFPNAHLQASRQPARIMPHCSSKGILRCVGARPSSLKSSGFDYQVLKKWQRDTVGVLKTQIEIAKEVIWRLDLAEEGRSLSPAELGLRRRLKLSYLGLLSSQKVKLRQHARITGIRLGDVNSKFFHAKVNGHRRKNYIQTLHSDHGVVITAEDKEQKRSIHDNFLHVQNLIKDLHCQNILGLFLKLDISKAFDSVNWAFLLEQILQLASRHGILKPIRARTARCRISLYSDDAGIFANPDKDELHAISAILKTFGEASGLITNLSKTEVFPIRCVGIDLQDVLSVFPAKIATFPRLYLGLPLHYRCLKGIDLQTFIDRFAGRLPGWKGKLLNKPGRVALAQSVLTAMATFHITTLNLSKGTLRKIDKIIQAFIWQKEDQSQTSRGDSLVNWKTVYCPRHLGGLGIMDLERFSRALRLRWPWLQWTDPERPWVGSKLPCDQVDMNLFRACTSLRWAMGKRHCSGMTTGPETVHSSF
ncbi:uncharacterized protein [Aegilops tauschii subsp. strangulata]|uniref:uncharacterized protein n=1 Tax=Aegilops tauschii subsp. strangulata TaxID=200361 RepID=UPI003CC862A9